jgi:hypothetical protein
MLGGYWLELKVQNEMVTTTTAFTCEVVKEEEDGAKKRLRRSGGAAAVQACVAVKDMLSVMHLGSVKVNAELAVADRGALVLNTTFVTGDSLIFVLSAGEVPEEEVVEEE